MSYTGGVETGTQASSSYYRDSFQDIAGSRLQRSARNADAIGAAETFRAEVSRTSPPMPSYQEADTVEGQQFVDSIFNEVDRIRYTTSFGTFNSRDLAILIVDIANRSGAPLSRAEEYQLLQDLKGKISLSSDYNVPEHYDFDAIKEVLVNLANVKFPEIVTPGTGLSEKAQQVVEKVIAALDGPLNHGEPIPSERSVGLLAWNAASSLGGDYQAMRANWSEMVNSLKNSHFSEVDVRQIAGKFADAVFPNDQGFFGEVIHAFNSSETASTRWVPNNPGGVLFDVDGNTYRIRDTSGIPYTDPDPMIADMPRLYHLDGLRLVDDYDRDADAYRLVDADGNTVSVVDLVRSKPEISGDVVLNFNDYDFASSSIGAYGVESKPTFDFNGELFTIENSDNLIRLDTGALVGGNRYSLAGLRLVKDGESYTLVDEYNQVISTVTSDGNQSETLYAFDREE